MAQAMKKPEEARTFAYQVTTGSGAIARTFIVEFDRPLQRDPNRPQESYLEQLRDAMRRPQTQAAPGDPVIRSVKVISPLSGNPENTSAERLRQALGMSAGEIFIAPAAGGR
ncbi:MAG: hypothetical protein U0R44_03525 [Candidatus Micrarchaeia archaeon]